MLKRLLLKLTQKYLIPTLKFEIGDVVQHLNGDEMFAVVGIYYDYDLNAHLFITDASAKIFGVNPDFYKKSADMEKIQNANY